MTGGWTWELPPVETVTFCEEREERHLSGSGVLRQTVAFFGECHDSTLEWEAGAE